MLILCLSYCRNQLSILSSVTLLVIGRTGVWTQAVWLQTHALKYCFILSLSLLGSVNRLIHFPGLTWHHHSTCAWRFSVLPQLSPIISRPFDQKRLGAFRVGWP